MRAVESMLLVAPNRSVDLEGLIGPVGPIEAVEPNGVSTELCGRIPTQRRHLPPVLIEPLVPMSIGGLSSGSSTVNDATVGLGGSIRMDLLCGVRGVL